MKKVVNFSFILMSAGCMVASETPLDDRLNFTASPFVAIESADSVIFQESPNSVRDALLSVCPMHKNVENRHLDIHRFQSFKDKVKHQSRISSPLLSIHPLQNDKLVDIDGLPKLKNFRSLRYEMAAKFKVRHDEKYCSMVAEGNAIMSASLGGLNPKINRKAMCIMPGVNLRNLSFNQGLSQQKLDRYVEICSFLSFRNTCKQLQMLEVAYEKLVLDPRATGIGHLYPLRKKIDELRKKN